MRRVCYSVAASLDGYIAGPGGEFDWIPEDPDIDMAALFAGYDTVLMGRASYEASLAVGQGAIPGLQTHVFSRTLSPQDCPGVIVSASAVETVSALRQAAGKDIWLFGGGVLFHSLLDAGLVDAVQVAVVPVLLGSGRPLLARAASRTTLRRVAHRAYEKSGIVMLDYEVVDRRA